MNMIDNIDNVDTFYGIIVPKL